jgi:hypothetical protein
MTVGQTSVDKKSVVQMSDKPDVSCPNIQWVKIILAKCPLTQKHFGQMSVNDLSFGEISLDQMFFNQMRLKITLVKTIWLLYKSLK